MTTQIREKQGAYQRSGFRRPHSKVGCKSLRRLTDFGLSKIHPPGNIGALFLIYVSYVKTIKKHRKNIHACVCKKGVKLLTAWFIHRLIILVILTEKKGNRSQDLHPARELNIKK